MMKLLISAQQIHARVQEIAQEVDDCYQGQEVVLVAVMKGALCIAADLLRALRGPTVLEWVAASSYGKKGSKRGELVLGDHEHLHLKGKHVLLVDDIFDSGQTLHCLIQALQKHDPRSLKTLVLLSKQKVEPRLSHPDYVLFSVPDQFVIGWGLDYKEQYRGLNGIYTVEEGFE